LVLNVILNFLQREKSWFSEKKFKMSFVPGGSESVLVVKNETSFGFEKKNSEMEFGSGRK
jgi:hypothetical protein